MIEVVYTGSRRFGCVFATRVPSVPTTIFQKPYPSVALETERTRTRRGDHYSECLGHRFLR